MNTSKLVKIGGILIVLLALAALIGSSLTFAQDEPGDSVTIPEDGSETEEATPWYGRFSNRGPRGHHGGLVDREAARELLAEELGVTVEDLETAHEVVMDAILPADGRPDRDEVRALIAAELGVTVEELEAAQTAVQETILAQLLADGTITQEQLDEMLAMHELRGVAQDIFSRDDAQAVIAEALGLTLEDLAAAREDGTRIWELADAQGVDMATVMTAVTDARTAAFAQAVEDGILTQEQADLLLSQRGPHMGGPGGPGGKGGHGGHSGPRGGGFGNGNGGGGNGNGNASANPGA